MTAEPYDELAGVYDWLVPEFVLAPQDSAAVFADGLALRSGARVLDCAAGTGQLAVGLALRGFDVAATDASGAMIERTRGLAAEHGVAVDARTCTWEQLSDQGWADGFDAVFCIGNSLTHAAGQAARRRALTGMAAVLREGGPLVLTSRNWELVRAAGRGLDVGTQLVQRGGRRGLTIHVWTLAEDWDDRHDLDVAVALIDDDGGVRTISERLAFWPYAHTTLDEDLRAVGLEPLSSTYESHVERYRVVALRGHASS